MDAYLEDLEQELQYRLGNDVPSKNRDKLVWLNVKNEEIPIKEMSDKYIINCINHIKRRVKELVEDSKLQIQLITENGIYQDIKGKYMPLEGLTVLGLQKEIKRFKEAITISQLKDKEIYLPIFEKELEKRLNQSCQ